MSDAFSNFKRRENVQTPAQLEQTERVKKLMYQTTDAYIAGRTSARRLANELLDAMIAHDPSLEKAPRP